jgi:hypothetical protein
MKFHCIPGSILQRTRRVLTLPMVMASITLFLAAFLGGNFDGWAAPSAVSDHNVEKMDVETHNFLIQKLENVIKQTPERDSTRVPSILRLADLLSERARLWAMQEVERGCLSELNSRDERSDQKDDCNRSSRDRKKAIFNYELALKESSVAVQSRILFQLAHLYELSQDNRKAEASYRRILSVGSQSFSQAVLGQSQAGLAEIAFREKRFQEAKRGFELALENPATPRKGWLHYRIAWSDLNLGEPRLGKDRLLMILKSPGLMTLDSATSSTASKPDASFQEDISRDLSIFYARTGFNKNDIEQLWALSPKMAQKEILTNLAEEAERLGQRKSAIDVWTMMLTRAESLNKLEKTESLIRIASLRYGLGENDEAVANYRTAAEQLKRAGCDQATDCERIRKRFRKLVLDWNKNEETKLTPHLLEIYKSYVSVFSDDPEMAFWGANVARSLGTKFRLDALRLYRIASTEAKKKLSSATKDRKLLAVFEGSLLSEIELAEQSNDSELRESAYRRYIELNPNGAKALEVRYQVAHVTYTRGETSKAADMFFELAARDADCRVKDAPSFCRQAADLALDAVAILRNDTRLEAMGEELAKLYPQAAHEYLGISRRARLNIAASAADSGRLDEMKENLERLKKLNLEKASSQEVLLTLKNRFVLAEKIRNFDEASAAALAIIKYKGATAKQREDAMAKRLWVAEMQLDFSLAYEIALKMEHLGRSPAERELRLSFLSELAGRDASRHLRNFIRVSKDSRSVDSKSVLGARVNLIKLSGYSENEFMIHFDELKRTPEILASMGLEVYARTHSKSLADRLLAVRGVAKTEDGSLILRSREIGKISLVLQKLAQSKLSTSIQDRSLSRAIQYRVQALSKAEQLANGMIKTGDVWLQALTLQALANENRRLKDEILSLPVPIELKEVDRKRYLKLVNKQVEPFEVKAMRIQDKVQKFWRMNPAEGVALAIENSRGPKRQLIANEGLKLAEALMVVGQMEAAKRIRTAAETDQQTVRVAAFERARRSVKEDPFDLENIRRLRELEAKAGSATMVAYLDSRISRMGVRP